MRINTNVASLNAQNKLGATSAAAAKTIGRLSSGFRINSASDDAAGLGIANKLRAETRALKQAARNAEQANAMIQIMEGASTTIGNMLERMKELATQAASDNVDQGGRDRINAEFQQLIEEVDRVVNTTKFQGDVLLNDADLARSFLVSSSGSYGQTVDDEGTPAVGPSADLITVNGTDLRASTLGISSLQIGGTETVEGEEVGVGSDAARTALTAIDAAIDIVNTALGAFGAAQNRIEYATQNVKTTIENFSAAESTIRDADMASEMSTFTKQQILQQAGVAMLAQANSAPQQILRLLQ